MFRRLVRRIKKFTFSSFILELISIVIAIVLGFIVTEWRAAQLEKNKAKDAVYLISKEVDQNKATILAALSYYTSILEQMDTIGTQNIKSPSDLADWQGMNPIALQAASYKMALQAGLLFAIDFQDATAISQYYTAVEDLHRTNAYGRQSLLMGKLESTQENYTLQELFRQHCEVLLYYTEKVEQGVFNALPTQN